MGARPGFTLIEILVGLAIMVILAATILPSVVTSLDRARVERAERSLQNVADGIGDFFADVGEMPQGMDQLVGPPGGGSADICGDGYTGGERNAWAGPYLDRAVPAGGFPVGIGTLNQAFLGDPAPPANPTLLHLVVTGVLLEDATALDARLDGDGGQGTGVIRWTNSDADGYVTAYWTIPVASC